MERIAIKELYKWQKNPKKRPLILRGTRQVGKTWLMKEFARQAYKSSIYINCDNNRVIEQLFAEDLVIERIIKGIELYAGEKFDINETLLIFDEIQEIPRALTTLKYFSESEKPYNIICAGSLLGVALHQGTSFPVGKVEFLDLYPLSFIEFLNALGYRRYCDLMTNQDFALLKTFSTKLIDLLKQYYYIGGMPEVVASFCDDGDYEKARIIQKRILDAFEFDFSKHAPSEIVPKIRMLWKSIPQQLAKENKKFIYSMVKEGGRAREFEYALMWLNDCGLVRQLHRVTAPRLPLRAYEDVKAFKLFLLDIGLLTCMCDLKAETIIMGNSLFTEFKGALTEQYVLQELTAAQDFTTYYWANERNNAEIDFLLDNGRQVIPMEVKAGINLKSKSLKVYREKFIPQIALRCSLAAFKDQGNLIDVPLYLVNQLAALTGGLKIPVEKENIEYHGNDE